jgi:hypothetical protein
MGAAIMAFVIEEDQEVPASRFVVEYDAVSPAPTSPKNGFKWTDILQPIAAPLEVGAQMITGLGAQPMAGLAGLLGGGTVDERTERIRGIQKAMTYEPKTELGKGLSTAISYPVERAMEATKAVGGFLGEKIGGEQGRIAGESIGEVAIPVAGTLVGGGSMLKSAKTQAAASKQALVDKSLQDAARIDAAKLAVDKYGLSLDPVISNPTRLNALRVTTAGQDHLLALLRRENEPKVAAILKDDLGIPKNVSLNSVEPFEAVRQAVGGAKRQIQTMTGFVDDGSTASTISSLQPEALIGGKATQKKVGRMIDEANTLVSSDVNGARLVSEIENLRKTARDIYKGTDIKPTQRAVADASMGIANALEKMIENNLQNLGMTDLLAQYRDGRVKMAKSYTLQEATNLNTGLVDPLVIAKMTSKDNALSGAFADVGKIAGNFPEALGIKPGAPGGFKELAATHMTRTGAGGMTGYVVGGMFGQPLLGAGIGAGLGELGGSMYARRLATNPKVQQAISIPKDYRNMLTGNPP